MLAAVPGTTQAEDAALLGQVPKTPALAAAQVRVTYLGTPQFVPVKGTTMQYANNTADKVLLIGGVYYLSRHSAWWMSPTPQGPWARGLPASGGDLHDPAELARLHGHVRLVVLLGDVRAIRGILGTLATRKRAGRFRGSSPITLWIAPVAPRARQRIRHDPRGADQGEIQGVLAPVRPAGGIGEEHAARARAG